MYRLYNLQCWQSHLTATVADRNLLSYKFAQYNGGVTLEACLELFTSTQVTNILFILWIIDDHSSHDVNLEHLFDFHDETGILETLRQRYSQENFTNEEDLKIVFSDLIRESFKIYPIFTKVGWRDSDRGKSRNCFNIKYLWSLPQTSVWLCQQQWTQTSHQDRWLPTTYQHAHNGTVRDKELLYINMMLILTLEKTFFSKFYEII